MTIANRWLAYLDQSGIRYSHSVHEPAQTALETAKAERIPAHDLAKTVVYCGENGFGMAVLPADNFVNLTELSRLLGISYIRLANEAELRALFPDCELGAMPPMGQLYNMPVLLDEELAARPFIAFPAGTHRDIARIGMRDYLRIVKPLIGEITVREHLLV